MKEMKELQSAFINWLYLIDVGSMVGPQALCFERNYFSVPTPKRRLDGGSTRVRHAARIPSHARKIGDAPPQARGFHS